MRPETAQKKLAALLGLEESLPVKPSTLSPSQRHGNATRSREAEAVIDYVATPYRYRKVNCRICKREFAVDRTNVACCSDNCRAEELSRIGIEWDWTRNPEERWVLTGNRTAEPLVVPPDALPLAMEAARNTLVNTDPPSTPEVEPVPVALDDLLDPTLLGAHLL